LNDNSSPALSSSGGRLHSRASDLHDRQPLTGQFVVFTGKLSLLGRRDACALVARLGGTATDDISARTTMVVVGDEGFGSAPPAATARGLAPASVAREKSNKLKRAEALSAQAGASIRILN